MNIFDSILKFEYKNNIGLVNMTDEFFALYINQLHMKQNKGVLIVTPSLYETNNLFNSISNYTEAFIFQADDIIANEAIAASPELKIERLNTINNLLENNNKVVLTDINGYLKFLPKQDEYKKRIVKLKVNQNIKPSILIEKMFNMGYTRVSLVTSTGEIGIRGFVVDLFPINEENPIRIEFFGDEIESIRYFEADTQKSINMMNEITIYPYVEFSSDTLECTNLYSYMENPIVVFKDYEQIKIAYERMITDIFLYAEEKNRKYFYDLLDINAKETIYYLNFDNSIQVNLSKLLDFNTKEAPKLNEDIDKINKYLKDLLDSGKTVVLALSTISVNKFQKELRVSNCLTDETNIIENTVNIIKKRMNKGFICNNYVILSEYELFNRKNEVKRRNLNYKFATRITDLSKIEIGDYVVHDAHGIGVYNGIKILEKNGLKSDYLEILYDKKDKLYIPVSKINLISKYSGKEGYVPKINSLNSVAWANTKQKVKEKIRYEAKRLIKVQAMRELKKGFAFSKDSAMQIMFENEFQYEETKDQLKVTHEIKQDMESIIPMDRILCGDVGYGKTEVAFRAMFKACLDSKQILYVCPTTLLSKQQYESARDRFRNYPVNIGLLNRFTSSSETNRILEELSNGKIDIVIGTHRLFSNDIKPKDLGLLIIDEEQRFGVAHKEKIKEFKENIDILTLTATPIPRTLQMAMLGIKSLSLIETPPKNRRAVQTYVTPYDKKIIRDIVYKEMSRNGQVFILYNRVEDIEVTKAGIERIIPDARVIYAHGQMAKKELEDRISEFIDKKYDILLCTTIIETGIDIPNVNSLIILNADRFGLSQLYQIRGRVGRSDRIAYAYLMYDKNKILTESAIKRLKVIKEFTELGSGFGIASRDLSIRGAGDILGAEQAGFIDSVGIDLYMRMLESEIMRLKGIEVSEEDDEISTLINISNHIKDSYVSDEDIKIEIHKLINSIDSDEKLEHVKQEIEDRFGKIDENMLIYMQEELFEKLTRNKGIESVVENNAYIELIITKEKSNSINYQELFTNSLDICKKFIFKYKGNRLRIKIPKNNLEKHPIEYLNELIKKM